MIERLWGLKSTVITSFAAAYLRGASARTVCLMSMIPCLGRAAECREQKRGPDASKQYWPIEQLSQALI
jgi:hypothetical protein